MPLSRLRLGRRSLLRGGFALAALGVLSGCGLQRAAPAARRPARIGMLTRIGVSGLPQGRAFEQGLRDLSWSPGLDLEIVPRFAGGPEAAAVASAELAGLGLDVIVVDGNERAAALKAATGAVPIVMANGQDPVAAGLVERLDRPGGNVTGLASFGLQLTVKRLELLKEVLPGARRIAVIWNPETAGSLDEPGLLAAAGLGVEVHVLSTRGRQNAPILFQAALDARAEGVVAGALSELGNPHAWVPAQMQTRLPVATAEAELTRDGLLLSYGPSVPDQYRRAAAYVDKILRGARPADLPVEQPTTFELTVNLETARLLGLTVPRSVLLQATEVIQ